jgi:hypothetical protein
MVKRANRNYTTKFKSEAVALVAEQGYSVPSRKRPMRHYYARSGDQGFINIVNGVSIRI